MTTDGCDVEHNKDIRVVQTAVMQTGRGGLVACLNKEGVSRHEGSSNVRREWVLDISRRCMTRLHGDRNVKILKYTVCLHLHCGSRLSASSISMAVRNGGKKSGPSVCTA